MSTFKLEESLTEGTLWFGSLAESLAEVVLLMQVFHQRRCDLAIGSLESYSQIFIPFCALILWRSGARQEKTRFSQLHVSPQLQMLFFLFKKSSEEFPFSHYSDEF